MNVIIASLNTAIERLLLVDKQQPGEVHSLLDDKTLAGGKGVNVARVMRQLGTLLPDAPTPRLLGFLGGATGRLCRELLAEEALATRAFAKSSPRYRHRKEQASITPSARPSPRTSIRRYTAHWNRSCLMPARLSVPVHWPKTCYRTSTVAG